MISLLASECSRLSDSREYLIAYSGGMDSHVLLHAMTQWRNENSSVRLRAVHVNHGLSDYADDWQLHCQRVCNDLNIPFLSEKIRLNNKNESLEAAAREARYRVLANCLEENECLLTAHHQDDQAETVLLQLLRGAGPKGLSAMPLKKPFAHSVHLRPLLNVSRKEVNVYATQHQLQWIDDESNAEVRFDRNYLRHHVMPALLERWPAATTNIVRSARHCGHAADLLTDLAEDDYSIVQGSQTKTLSVAALLRLSESRRVNVLRHWLSRMGCRLPNTQQLQQLQRDVLLCDVDAMPVFELESKVVRRYRDDLYCLSDKSVDTTFEMQWDCRSSLLLPDDLGTLFPEDFLEFQQLTVRFRRGGESIKPTGSAHTQSLKKLFQQWGVPPWQRDRVPLLFDGDRLIAVVGYCLAE